MSVAARIRLQEIYERRFWDEDGEAEMLREFLYNDDDPWLKGLERIVEQYELAVRILNDVDSS